MGDEPKKGLNAEGNDPLEETLEAEWMDGTSESETHQRKKIRFSLRDRNDCWVIIGNKKYHLCDLSNSGIGISAEPKIVFQIGQFLSDILNDCTLNIMGSSIPGLNYKMVHISPDTGNRMICGLYWLNPGPETRQLMASAIQSLKMEAFPENDPGKN